jgi:hypothetical protein
MKILVCFELFSLFRWARYFYIISIKQYHDFLALLDVPVAYMEQIS